MFTVGAGTVTVTLTTVGPPVVSVGLGIGVPGGGASCNLSMAVGSAAPATTPQISVPVDAGTYCVQVYDVGAVPDHINFTVSVTHP